MRWTRPGPLRMAVLLVVAVVSTSAIAAEGDAQTIAIAPLDGDLMGYSALLEDSIRQQLGYDVVSESELGATFRQIGCELGRGGELDMGCLLAVTDIERVDAVLTGAVIGAPTPRVVEIDVLDGVDGREAGSLSIAIDGGIIEQQEMSRALAQLSAIVSTTGWEAAMSQLSGAPPPAPPATTASGAGFVSSSAAPTDDAGARRDRVVRASIQPRIAQRRFELTSATRGVLYESAYYPGLRLDVEFFPGPLFSDSKVLNALGVYAATAKHNVLTELVLDDGRGAIDIPTRHDETAFGLRFDLQEDDWFIRAGVGYRAIEFALGFNEVYQSSFYTGFDLHAEAGYEVFPSTSLALAAGLAPSLSLGDTVAAYGTDASALGLRVGVLARYTHPIGAFASAGFTYESIATTYSGEGTEGLQDVSATDRFQIFTLGLGYAY